MKKAMIESLINREYMGAWRYEISLAAFTGNSISHE